MISVSGLEGNNISFRWSVLIIHKQVWFSQQTHAICGPWVQPKSFFFKNVLQRLCQSNTTADRCPGHLPYFLSINSSYWTKSGSKEERFLFICPLPELKAINFNSLFPVSTFGALVLHLNFFHRAALLVLDSGIWSIKAIVNICRPVRGNDRWEKICQGRQRLFQDRFREKKQ